MKLELRESLSPAGSPEVTAHTEMYVPGDTPEQGASPGEGTSNTEAGDGQGPSRLEGLAGPLRANDPKAGGPPGGTLLSREAEGEEEEKRKKNSTAVRGLETEGQLTKMSPFKSSPGSMVMQMLVWLSPWTLLWERGRQRDRGLLRRPGSALSPSCPSARGLL